MSRALPEDLDALRRKPLLSVAGAARLLAVLEAEVLAGARQCRQAS